MQNVRNLVASVKKIAEADPQSAGVSALVEGLEAQLDALETQVEALGDMAPAAEAPESEEASETPEAPAEEPAEAPSTETASTVFGQLASLRRAAEAPLKNYQRIVALCTSLERVANIASRPQYAAARPHVAACVQKLAGIFSKVDTVEDLDKPLEQIESAIHSLYKNPNDPSTYNFSAKNKGPYRGS